MDNELAEKIKKGQFKIGRTGGSKATMTVLWNAALAAERVRNHSIRQPLTESQWRLPFAPKPWNQRHTSTSKRTNGFGRANECLTGLRYRIGTGHGNDLLELLKPKLGPGTDSNQIIDRF